MRNKTNYIISVVLILSAVITIGLFYPNHKPSDVIFQPNLSVTVSGIKSRGYHGNESFFEYRSFIDLGNDTARVTYLVGDMKNGPVFNKTISVKSSMDTSAASTFIQMNKGVLVSPWERSSEMYKVKVKSKEVDLFFHCYLAKGRLIISFDYPNIDSNYGYVSQEEK